MGYLKILSRERMELLLITPEDGLFSSTHRDREIDGLKIMNWTIKLTS
jgi:hypothetical protein